MTVISPSAFFAPTESHVTVNRVTKKPKYNVVIVYEVDVYTVSIN